jgi:hypothetical protein
MVDLLTRARGEKLLIFDACRNVPGTDEDGRFDPGKLNTEFASRAFDASFLFSASAGQVAREQSTYTISERSKSEGGNGIFTYALMRALTSHAADISEDSLGRGRIEVSEISRFMRKFFDPADPKSGAEKFRSVLREAGSYLQQPIVVPSRSVDRRAQIVRSLPTGSVGKPSLGYRSLLCGWSILKGYEFWCGSEGSD